MAWVSVLSAMHYIYLTLQRLFSISRHPSCPILPPQAEIWKSCASFPLHAKRLSFALTAIPDSTSATGRKLTLTPSRLGPNPDHISYPLGLAPPNETAPGVTDSPTTTPSTPGNPVGKFVLNHRVHPLRDKGGCGGKGSCAVGAEVM